MKIGELVEWLITFRDYHCKSHEESRIMADAINLIDHGFDAQEDVYDAIESGKYNR